MVNLGKVKPGSTIYVPFDTFDGGTGASITMSGLAVTDIEIYKAGSMTQRSSDTGYTLLDTDGIDLDGLTGIHGFSVDLSSNADAGFFAAGSRYYIVVSAITVDAQTVSFVAAWFEIAIDGAMLNTTIATLSSQTSFTLTDGPAEDDALNGCVCYIHDVASAVQGGFAVVQDYTGSTKTVTLTAGVTFTAAATDNIGFFPPTNTRWFGTTAQTANDVGADVDAILVDTGTTLDGRIPAALVGGRMDANVGAISSDATAADNAEAFFDGTGYAGTNNVIPTVTTVTNNVAGVDSAVTLNNYDSPVTAGGTAQAGAASTITLEASASAVNDFYAGQSIRIYGGTGIGQVRRIVSYVGATKVATVDRPWATNPSSDSNYAVQNDSGPRVDSSIRSLSDAVAISGDATAADNAEAFFDGTGYAGTNNVIPTVTTLTGHTPQTGDNFARLGAPAGASVSADIAAIEAQTDDIGTAGAGLTAVPWNAAWDAEVQSEATDALNAYDPPTRAEATTDVNSVLAVLQGAVLAKGTIGSTGNDTTHLHLTGLTYGNDELNSLLLVVFDVSESEYHARWISDWDLASALATVATLPFTPQNATDTYWILSARADVTGGSGLDAAGVRAAIGLASANLDTQLAAIEDQTDEIGTAGAGLTAVPWNAAWDAEVQSEATDALNAYDPPTRAEATTDVNSVLAVLQGIVLVKGTIGSTGNDTTHLHLTGLTYGNDEINSHLLVIYDVSENEYHARWIEDWVLATALATVATLPFTPQNATDTYWLLPCRADVTGGSGLDAAGVRAAIGLASANLDTQLSTIDDFVDTEIGNIQSRLPAALVGGRMDSSVGAMAANTLTASAIATDAIDADAIAGDAIGSSELAATAASEIAAAVLAALAAGTNAEPSSVPAANASLNDKIGFLFALARNKITQTAAELTLFADNGSTEISSAAVSDDGTTLTKSEHV